jgi:hypothetical protein
MNDVVEVEKLKTVQNAGNKKFGLTLLESPTTTHVISEIPTHEQVHDEKQIFPILKREGHVHNERMLQFGKQLTFIQNGMNALFLDNLCLVHLLHRVYLPCFFKLHTPHLAETTLTDYILTVKMLLRDLSSLQQLLFLTLKFGEINLETILHFFGGFLGNRRVASVVLFRFFVPHLLALFRILLDRHSSRHYSTSTAINALFS